MQVAGGPCQVLGLRPVQRISARNQGQTIDGDACVIETERTPRGAQGPVLRLQVELLGGNLP